MSRKNEGKTKPDVLYRKREILLKESDNRLLQLEKILQVLKANEVDDSLIRKLHKRELARKARLTKLLKEGED